MFSQDEILETAKTEDSPVQHSAETQPLAIIAKIAALQTATPAAIINNLDNSSLWLNAATDFSLEDTMPLLNRWNEWVIETNATQAVANIEADPRFCDASPNPNAIPNLHHYYGLPILNKKGDVTGTLCLLDNKPIEIDEQQANQLQMLIELIATLDQQNPNQNFLFESIPLLANAQLNSTSLLPALSPSAAYHVSSGKNGSSNYDRITGLINRTALSKQVQKLLSALTEQESHTEEHVVVYLKLALSKFLPEQYNQLVENELLQQFSALLLGNIRKKDSLAKLEKTEFALLVRDCSLQNSQRITQKLLSLAAEYRFGWQGKFFEVNLSIGLVPIICADNCPEILLQTAQTACSIAADLGSNQIYVLHEQPAELKVQFREEPWSTRIPSAIAKNQFVLYAQPIQQLGANSDLTFNFEILLRLQGDAGEIIAPGQFMPAAEQYHLAQQIDCWVISNALEWLAVHPHFLDRLALCSINLSAQSLADPNFDTFVIAQLAHFAIPASKICFEVTEASVLADLAKTMELMYKLKTAGCQFALDNFSNTASSFGYLKSLPIDILKIDGHFVREIVNDPVNQAFVRSINEIAQLLGKETVAEFVENREILSALEKMGVNYAQGYGISIPMNFTRFMAWVDNSGYNETITD